MKTREKYTTKLEMRIKQIKEARTKVAIMTMLILRIYSELSSKEDSADTKDSAITMDSLRRPSRTEGCTLTAEEEGVADNSSRVITQEQEEVSTQCCTSR